MTKEDMYSIAGLVIMAGAMTFIVFSYLRNQKRAKDLDNAIADLRKTL